MKALGIILIVVGIALTIFTGVSFFTKEKVLDIGKLEISREKPNRIAWSPIIGVVIAGIGGVILWQGTKK